MKSAYPIRLSVDALMAKAREIADVAIVDSAVVEPLTVLVNSMNAESRLHEKGAVAMQKKLLRLLANRLRMQRDFARYPEIAEQKLVGVVVVIGMGRSGTTKTQKVLSASGDFNWLPFWQAYNPALFTGSRDEAPAARIREADEYCRWFDRESPETKLGHSFETFEPEEDTALTEGCFVTPSFLGYSDVPGYLQWLGGQSQLTLFEYLCDALKYLQWQGLASASKPWLLKAPTYYGLENELLTVFPDARFVMTHRSPLQTVPSSCKLIENFRIPFCNAPINPIELTMGFAMMMDVHINTRKTNPQFKVLDLSFDEVNRSMPNVIEKIYAHAGMRLTEAARARMAQWGSDNPMHKKGGFKYSLEEFGLSADQVTSLMANYLALQDELFGKNL